MIGFDDLRPRLDRTAVACALQLSDCPSVPTAAIKVTVGSPVVMSSGLTKHTVYTVHTSVRFGRCFCDRKSAPFQADFVAPDMRIGVNVHVFMTIRWLGEHERAVGT